MHLTLRQLHYFIEIVDAGNMTRAAERLYVVPTALSLQVRAMEERLGVSLLQRHSRGVRPTRAGTELYRKGQQILAMVDETERLVSPGHGARGLRFGSPPSLLGPVGFEQVLEGSRRLGRESIQVVQGFSCDLMNQLHEGELDFVLTCEDKVPSSVRHLDLLDEALVFVTHPENAREDCTVTLAEALDSDLAFVGEKGVCWRIVNATARSAGLSCDIKRIVGSLDVARHLVRRGLATAILPFGTVEADRAKGTLVAHEIVDHPMYRRTSLAWRAESPEAADAGDFVDLMIDVVSDLHPEADDHFRILSHDTHPAAPAGLLAGLLPFLLPLHTFLESGNVYELAGMVQ